MSQWDDPKPGLAGQSLHAAALEVLRELTGRADAQFHPGQFEAIEALVADRRRSLVVQRTGWGKSAVYFIAALLQRRLGSGPALIVSPLLALMRDQVAAASRAGVRAESINSANATQWAAVAERLERDEVDVLLSHRSAWSTPASRPSNCPGSSHVSDCSSSTRPTASVTGGTTSAPTTAGSAP